MAITVGIIHVFSCINICRIPRKMLLEAAWPSVQTSSRDTASVNAMKQTCDCYSCILHDSSLKSHRKHRNNIKIFVFRMLILVVQNGVGLQNRTLKKSFPLTMLTSTKAQTKCSFRAVMFCRVTSCKQTSTCLEDFQVKTMLKQHVNSMI